MDVFIIAQMQARIYEVRQREKRSSWSTCVHELLYTNTSQRARRCRWCNAYFVYRTSRSHPCSLSVNRIYRSIQSELASERTLGFFPSPLPTFVSVLRFSLLIRLKRPRRIIKCHAWYWYLVRRKIPISLEHSFVRWMRVGVSRKSEITKLIKQLEKYDIYQRRKELSAFGLAFFSSFTRH